MYSKYHKTKLLITTSTYDLYFLVTTTRKTFRIIGIQINNIIILGNK
jgi:hypothetical protein